ncbi:hypothetical protein INR49_032546 [Caranx melampygus]|nr:hypothetical protein INR49_032546 [Caranx melampygus]
MGIEEQQVQSFHVEEQMKNNLSDISSEKETEKTTTEKEERETVEEVKVEEKQVQETQQVNKDEDGKSKNGCNDTSPGQTAENREDGLDGDIHKNERLDVENDRQKRGKERETVEDMTKDKGHDGESVPPVSLPHSQPGSPKPPEGVMKNVLDFVNRITEESTAHFAAVRKFIWITVEVGVHQQISIHGGKICKGGPLKQY